MQTNQQPEPARQASLVNDSVASRPDNQMAADLHPSLKKAHTDAFRAGQNDHKMPHTDKLTPEK